MGDFLLDFRRREVRCREAETLRFLPDISVDRIERDRFTLFVSRTERADLWGPFESDDGIVVALAGCVAPTEDEWRAGALVQGKGGLACKAIYATYLKRGIEGVAAAASGGFAVHVFDPRRNRYYLVNDAAGTLPCYSPTRSGELICSHADILADTANRENGSPSQSTWDLTSMAQFVSTGVVTHPHSYYKNIVALDFGCIHAFDLAHPAPPTRTVLRHTDWRGAIPSSESEDVIADRLAEAIGSSSRQRTAPVLGRSAIALSGGLDSRTILCAADRHPQLISFCAFDEQNAEYSLAKKIADSMGVTLIPFARSFEHYGDHAEMGVRISGGMGELVSNHFLGFRERLRELGVENLVTGCYFDYLFKSLALNARECGLLRQESFTNFSFQTYLPHFSIAGRFAESVTARLDELFPQTERQDTELARTHNALRRVFPLYHEGDNAQRLIPLRVMGWNPPATDPAILALGRTTPPAMKLNKRMFRKAVARLCSKEVLEIPDNNTGLPVRASTLLVGLNRYLIAIRHRMERKSGRLATRDSWPNWPFYVRTSRKLHELWLRPNPIARSLISELCDEPFREDIASYGDRPTQHFMRLLTLKLWLDQRV